MDSKKKHLGLVFLNLSILSLALGSGCKLSSNNESDGLESLSCSQSPLLSVADDGGNTLGKRTLRTRGRLKIYGILGTNLKSSYQYVLEESNGTQRALYWKNVPPNYQTGDSIEVTGTPIPNFYSEIGSTDSAISVDSSSTLTDSLDLLALSNTLGAQATAAIVIDFSNLANPSTVNDIQNLVFNQVDQFWKENSFQKTWLTGKALGPYKISVPSTSCDTNAIASQAKAAAQAAGENLSAYTRFIYIFPKNTGCGGWLGLGTVGGRPSESWINNSAVLHTVAHELGHNLGLYHANALNCGTSTLGSSCSSIEYGDPSDIMGNYLPGHYSAFHKERLGWIGGSNTPAVTWVQGSGIFNIQPYETQSTDTKALKVLKSTDASGRKTYYYIEYRQSLGFDSVLGSARTTNNLTNGVLIHTGSESSGNTSYLLNMNPTKGSFYQAALTPGQTFQDSTAGVSITLDSMSSTAAVVSVSMGGQNPPNPTPTTTPSPTPGSMTVDVSTDQGSYESNQTILVDISSNTPSRAYSLTITGPGGFSFTKYGTLSTTGTVKEFVQITSCAPKGTYQAKVRLDGQSESQGDIAQFQIH